MAIVFLHVNVISIGQGMFLEITMKVKGTFQDLAVFGVGTLKTLDRTNLVKFDLMPEFFYTLGKSGFEFEIEIQNQSESIYYIRELRTPKKKEEAITTQS